MQRMSVTVLFLLAGLAGMVSAPFMTAGGYPWVGFFCVIVGALPSLISYVRVLGMKKGVLALLALGAFALFFEGSAIYTGFPYGYFSYSSALGPKLADLVPWSVPFAWVPLILMAGSLATRFTRKTWGVLILGTAVLLGADLVVDPVAVALGFWEWEKSGAYYGIPFLNFLGWGLSGAIGMWIWWSFSRTRVQQIPLLGLSLSALFSLSFFTGISLALGMVIPAALGILLVGAVLHICYHPSGTRRSS